jgi:hypothetical protein
MAWQSGYELNRIHRNPGFRAAFDRLYSLCLFWRECLVSDGYCPPCTVAEAVALTPYGQEWAARLAPELDGVKTGDLTGAMFLEFFHREPFVDVQATDAAAIARALDAGTAEGNVRYPWVYGRVLYDRFFELFPQQPSELSYEETRRLLDGTPPGVFQLADVIVGPFGLLISSSQRIAPPVRRLPLWHCSDPSCNAFHVVRLTSGTTAVGRAASQVRRRVEGVEGPPSGWSGLFYRSPSVRSSFYADIALPQLPLFLGSAFSERELRVLTQEVLTADASNVRPRLPGAGSAAQLFRGSADDIVGRLDHAQCLQVLLLSSDSAIVHALESLVDEGVIRIPPTETRTCMFGMRSRTTWFNLACECSRLGVRATVVGPDLALARLKRLIKGLYGSPAELKQLEWALRHVDGETIADRLDQYLHTEDPRRVLRDLVLSSPEHTRTACKSVRYGRLPEPSSQANEELLIDRLLWKLGFAVRSYPPHQGLFWDRLAKLEDAVKAHALFTEKDMEAVRSCAVNFFVSLEEILDYGLSFATWALLSDHYATTRFRCDLALARRFMARRLNEAQPESSQPSEYDPEGKNTLAPLVQGFALLADVCSRMAEHPADFARPADGFPHYHGQTDIEVFPFLHTAFILDARDSDRLRVIHSLREITARLTRANTCSVRNRIEHKRPDFPTAEEVQLACTVVADVVEDMELLGICPLIYLYAGSELDEFGRSRDHFRDYRGRDVVMLAPTQHRLCGLPDLNEAGILMPAVHVGDSLDIMRFEYEEASDYATMWSDYPRRRVRTGMSHEPQSAGENEEGAAGG